MLRKRLAVTLAAATLGSLSLVSPAEANHAWGTYHWARTTTSFTLQLGDNLTAADWKSYLAATSADWNAGRTPVQTTVVPGTSNKRCSMVSGTTQVCNGSYGKNGWLGLATINISGSHITQGSAKMNDTYFSTAKYNNPNEKLHVICQEVAHTFGLGHQSEDGSSQNSCMDYFSNTGANAGSTLSTAPNQHDYDQLATIYGHLDSSSTVGLAPVNGLPAEVPSWANASESVYVDHLPNGQTQVTYVLWANPIRGWGG
jgi:hypothetical protein